MREGLTQHRKQYDMDTMIGGSRVDPALQRSCFLAGDLRQHGLRQIVRALTEGQVLGKCILYILKHEVYFCVTMRHRQ